MAPSSDVNDTDEDKSNNSIVHETFDKPSSENLFMDVSGSECNIFNETLSQSNSVITLVSTSDESDCDKVSLTMLHSDSLTSINRLFDEGLSKVTCTTVMKKRWLCH